MKKKKTTKKEKVAVFIDGNNFYKYLKNKEINFLKGKKFDLDKFVKFLANGRDCVSKRYYVGIARNVDGSEKSKKSGRIKGIKKLAIKLLSGRWSF